MEKSSPASVTEVLQETPAVNTDYGAEKKINNDVEFIPPMDVDGPGFLQKYLRSQSPSELCDAQMFSEDEVFRIDRNGKVKFGIVLETVDTNSGGEEEEEDYERNLNKGEVRVSFYPEGKRVIYRENAIGLVDRSFMLGDIVRRLVKGMDTQRGYVQEVKINADVKVCGSKYVVTNISSERLSDLTDLYNECVVVMGPWVGTVKEVEERAVLRSTSGVRFDLDSTEFDNFNDNRSANGTVFNTHFFYPGNTVIGRPHQMSSVKLLPPFKPLPFDIRGKAIKAQYTVESLYVQSAWVHWQCRALSEDSTAETTKIEEPKNFFDGEDLKQIKPLKLPDLLRMNDLFFFELLSTDKIVKKSDWDREQAQKFKKIFKEQQKRNDKCLYQHKGNALKKLKKLPQAESTNRIKSAFKTKFQMPSHQKISSNDSDEDEEAESDKEDDSSWIDESSSATTSATVSNSSFDEPRDRKRTRKVKMLRKSKRSSSYASTDKLQKTFKYGEKVAVEALVMHSKITIMWQDGTRETDIPSTELYHINQLDTHEFFPGDYVMYEKDSNDMTYRDYGVIQSVDHYGRTARVKWFTTYTYSEEPKPTYNGITEESVYDLKDHPDFQYRPGTIVTRVDNFDVANNTNAAGQIINTCQEGTVKVRWVDGSITSCWPQDLFEVVDHEHDEYSEASDDSWETQSENSEYGDDLTIKMCPSHTLTSLETARVSLARLEEIFHLSPNLQSTEVMKKLIHAYKTCRSLDRVMDTRFFHEENFMGLIERVRKSGSQTESERALERKIRLFGDRTPSTSDNTIENKTKMMFNLSSTPLKCKTKSNTNEMCLQTATKESAGSDTNDPSVTVPKTDNYSTNAQNNEKNNLLSCAIYNIERAYEETCKLKFSNTSVASQDDSGNYSRNEGSAASLTDTVNPDGINSFYKTTDDPISISNYSIDITDDAASECARLCTLLKEQLHKFVEQIQEKFFNTPNIPEDNLSALKEFDSKEEMDSSKSDDEKEVITRLKPSGVLQSFKLYAHAPKSHKFYLTVFSPINAQSYFKAVQREHRMLRSSLPPGVYIRVFEDRLDLLSAMIEGPKNTPYENGLFFFDFQLGRDYPRNPPTCHYISYCTDRLNPNLYEGGKVCVSLLGTWSGRNTEIWGVNSTLLQVLVSIQGLILVNEPYYNEAGYEKHKETQQGHENSRMYNEMATIKLVQATSKLLAQPSELFRQEVCDYYSVNGRRFYNRIKGYIQLSNDMTAKTPTGFRSLGDTVSILPDFPLVPASRGFCLAVKGLLDHLDTQLRFLYDDNTINKPELSFGFINTEEQIPLD
ncbi:(E3-independent) E2 ubiquitin-conjugating enzyme isoform X2 [Teleopsis dalmanni]|nr:(E3-independent) E2 ubiquitin-conjugating enzyme isoform X2 [Teleopsis dalmanni]